MTYIVGVSILFICLLERGVSSTKKNIIIRSRRPHLYEFRSSIPMSDIARLQSLQDGIADLVATYEKPVFVTTIRTVRTIRWNRKKWRTNKRLIPTTKSYVLKKTYPLPSERMKVFYVHFLNLFSENDEEKRRNLTQGPVKDGKRSSCYMDLFTAFVKHCHYNYYSLGGMNKMKELLARICLSSWMTVDKAAYIFENTCKSRFKFKVLYNLTTEK